MGNDIDKGTIYAEGGVGGAGTVNAANLNAHVDEARIKSTFISTKSLKDPASLGDAFVVENSGVLYRETMQQVLDLLNTTIQNMLPVGVILNYCGGNPPAGWLLCYGQAISRTVYDELFAIIGVTYGAGNNIDTYNVPDLRGRIVAGKDNMGGTAAGQLTAAWGVDGLNLGASGGNQAHQLTIAQMPAHTHPLSSMGVGSCAAGGFSCWLNQPGYNTDSTGGGQYHPNVQPTLILNKIIRAQS